MRISDCSSDVCSSDLPICSHLLEDVQGIPQAASCVGQAAIAVQGTVQGCARHICLISPFSPGSRRARGASPRKTKRPVGSGQGLLPIQPGSSDEIQRLNYSDLQAMQASERKSVV